ncbi:MAG: ABC transporter substrate-binding protein [Deltaproteobacteria bacterium]|nr:ABC transporter substrate-binding protein [Deltaproteobacteria bacterium]
MAEKPLYGGELVVAMLNTPVHFNPAIQSGMATGLIGAQLFATPLRFDENWNPQPYLAEKWEIATDGLAVTLHLVKGATFHDGRPITSKDIEFSIMTVREHHPFKSMFASVSKVETPDPQTAIIRLSKPTPAIFLSMSSVLLPIIPKHIYGDGRDIRTHPANLAPVGSGPFKFVEYVPGKHVILERYQNYFVKGRPYLDKITYRFFRQADVEVPISMETGDCHILPYAEKGSDLKMAARQDNLVITGKGYKGIGSLFWLAFNLKKKPFDDLRVRQAIAHSIDRDFIVQTLYQGVGKKTTGPISPDSPFYSDDVEHYDVDVKRANELLDAAGYPRGQDGVRFKATIDFVVGVNTYLPLTEYLRHDLMKKIGVELTVRTSKTLSEWGDTVSHGRFDITIDNVFNWGDPTIGVHRTYDCNNIRPGVIWSNTQGYCNPKVNQLMEAAGSEMNFSKRKALYAEFQKLVVHDLPVFFISKPFIATIYHKNLAGIEDNIWGVLSPLDQVYWIKKP